MNARMLDRTFIYGSAVLLALWVIVPFYLIFLSAFSRPNDVFVYPKPLLPTDLSTETMQTFLQSTGVTASVLNSIGVALITIVLSLVLGCLLLGLGTRRSRSNGSAKTRRISQHDSNTGPASITPLRWNVPTLDHQSRVPA